MKDADLLSQQKKLRTPIDTRKAQRSSDMIAEGDVSDTEEGLETETESEDAGNARRKDKRKVIEVESDGDELLQPFTGPSHPPPPAPAAPDNCATKRTLKEMSAEEPAGKRTRRLTMIRW
ncbi:hypothetical protein FALBO_13054 [Fusarium albosuccineum]|uniref:Uncharacterized protein n=1 Tax=Fusarium albosuccineum TaxID=1237068 RepID=A0A8H4P2K0_9HYPO|nr:hypothetical protein FALBO_13054 [Fusarium albosuccineum]